ncbi:MAG: hypothetical protein ACO1RX_16345 [Candidatus Sericytochromatia bacterium]
MFKIMILSVGSLLGQVILDVLEGRREHLQIVGLNSIANAPSNYRCDQVFLTPETLDSAFLPHFEKLLQTWQPDFILPGRDDDIVFLAQYAEKYPQWQQKTPCGKAALATIFRDKWLSYQWAQERSLPFANSLWYEKTTDAKIYRQFLETVGFPLIAKPRQGFGSNGVLFLQTEAELERLSLTGPVLLQECLGNREHLGFYAQMYHQGMPLFFQIPQFENHSAQILIRPDGSCSQIFCSHNRFVMGKIEQITPSEPPDLMATVSQYATQLSQAGWRGPANIAALPNAKGEWKVHEINLRMTGATSLRLACGFDEIKGLLEAFAAYCLPVLPGPDVLSGVAHMVSRPQWIHPDWICQLTETKQWAKL